MMKRVMSVIWLLALFGLGALPCQAMAASITEKRAAIGEDCVAEADNSTAMGVRTVAKGLFSTAMGLETTAEGMSTTAMGQYTKAIGTGSTALGVATQSGGYGSVAAGIACRSGGWASFAGGEYMRLTENADNTFVWGSVDETHAVPMSAANAFLIFPLGTPGKVGIGTKDPQRIMHIVGVNPRILIEASSLNAEVNFKNSGDSNGVIWSVYKDGANHNLNFYQGGNKVTIQNTTGNVGIGTTNPGYKLEVNGSAAKPDGGFWSNSSDGRLKDITGEYGQGLNEIVRLRPITFRYKENNPRGLPSKDEYIGFIAQEVQEVFPEAVREARTGISISTCTRSMWHWSTPSRNSRRKTRP